MRQSKNAVMFIAMVAGTMGLRAATRPIYNEHADAGKLLQTGIAEARRTGKNVALIFGANWCSDCHALDAQMHQGELQQIVRRDFVVVKIDVGRFDKNVAFAARYGVPIKHGIPAIAILSSRGKVLFAQDHGQFANAGKMAYGSFLEFFEKWEPHGKASAAGRSR
jgi:thioredoxin 1